MITKETRCQILDLIHKEVVPAIGCTEPMAVALCTARATELLGCRPEHISLYLSANILKNAMGVGIPGTGMVGLPILNLENDKISTSRNWAVWLHEYLVDMPGKQDVLRYVLTANAPETKDNNFTWKDFQDRNNNELVAVYGNFVNRALQLTKKYWNGIVPECGELTETDQRAIDEFKNVKAEVEELLEQFKFREAQFAAMNLARIGNRYITECEPWKVWKTDPKRVETILYISLQLVANLSIAFEPFLPFSSKKLRSLINLQEFDWNQLGNTDLLKPGHQLAEPELLFEKIEDSIIEAQLQKLADTKKANEVSIAPTTVIHTMMPSVTGQLWIPAVT